MARPRNADCFASSDKLFRFVHPILTFVSKGPDLPLIAAGGRADLDMIITSTHGYSSLRHALLGSVGEELAREASNPVLIVPRHLRPGTSDAPEG
jgi:Universal stress protein family